jgi:hypothetical protein
LIDVGLESDVPAVDRESQSFKSLVRGTSSPMPRPDGDDTAGSVAKFEALARLKSAGCPLNTPKLPKPIESEPAGKVA